MANSNTASSKIQLPNGCSCTVPKILPNSLSMNEDWIVCYTFFDPEFPDGFRRQIRGMNQFKTYKKRLLEAKSIIQSELDLLIKEGFNPRRKIQDPIVRGSVYQNTPFDSALLTALQKVKGVKGTLTDMRSVVNGTIDAATKLGIHKMSVVNVSRKYFKQIFEQCKIDNPKFSNNRQNVYRKSLKRLFDELIEMEAVEVNPLLFIRKEKIIKKSRAIPTAEEREKLRGLKETHYYFWRAINIFFASGSRETEIMNVQKKHIDLKGQRCFYTVLKGKQAFEMWRPVTNASFGLWKEIYNECQSDEDYIFSFDLKPGAKKMTTESFSKRWKRHVKKGLGIDCDFYSLKYLNTTELMDIFDKMYNPAKEVQKLTGHKQEAMIIQIYDKNNKQRKDEKIKEVGGLL